MTRGETIAVIRITKIASSNPGIIRTASIRIDPGGTSAAVTGNATAITNRENSQLTAKIATGTTIATGGRGATKITATGIRIAGKVIATGTLASIPIATT